MIRKILCNVILIIAVIVFCFAAYKLIMIELEYKQGEDEYKKLTDVAHKPSDDADAPTDTGNGINWDELRAINPDIVAWIKFEEPAIIDYPVVQGGDNEYYLHHSFGENYINAGTIFVDALNKANFTDPNTFVYGHHMNNGSMFAELKEYKDQGFYNQHPNFHIYTPDGATKEYTIFATAVVDANSDLATQISFATAEDYAKFLAGVKDHALYDTGVTVTPANRIVSLYTCTNRRESERLIVYAVENGSESQYGMANNTEGTTQSAIQGDTTVVPSDAQPQE